MKKKQHSESATVKVGEIRAAAWQAKGGRK